MFTKRKASRILLDYVEGKGRGDEIDDYIHGRRSEFEEDKVVKPLLEINRKFSNSEFFIGISNPLSFNAIAELAKKLEKIGL